MKELSADGITFIDFATAEILKEYTKEEYRKTRYILKTPYYFWRYDANNNKIPINFNKEEYLKSVNELPLISFKIKK